MATRDMMGLEAGTAVGTGCGSVAGDGSPVVNSAAGVRVAGGIVVGLNSGHRPSAMTTASAPRAAGRVIRQPPNRATRKPLGDG